MESLLDLGGLIQAVKNQSWHLVITYLVLGVLSLLLSKRSQLDSWAESSPRLAGLMKIKRSLGLDPWMFVQGLMLFFAKRLPASAKVAVDNDKEPPSSPPSAASVSTVMLFLFVGAIAGSSVGLTGCSSLGVKDPSALVKSSEALAFNGAVTALEIVDAKQSEIQDAVAKPTADQLAKWQDRVDRLKRVREALAIARAWISGEKDLKDGMAALKDASAALKLLLQELQADNVKIPKPVLDGFAVTTKFLGL